MTEMERLVHDLVVWVGRNSVLKMESGAMQTVRSSDLLTYIQERTGVDEAQMRGWLHLTLDSRERGL